MGESGLVLANLAMECFHFNASKDTLKCLNCLFVLSFIIDIFVPNIV